MTNSTVYTFDRVTGEYIYKYERDNGTLTTIGDNDRTFDEVPPVKEGFVRLRSIDNTEWYYAADFRGKLQYSKTDGAESVIDYIGDLKSDYTLASRPAPYYIFDHNDDVWAVDPIAEAGYLNDIKVAKKAELTSARDARIDGFDVITISKGSFNVDRVGLNKLSNRLIAKQRANDDEVITSYVTTDLVLADLTKLDVIDILDCQDDIESQIAAYYVDLIDQINKAQTIDEVEAINWSDNAKQGS